MGNGDYLDIMAGVDEAIHTAPIDPDKMALIGYSYGGEMAGFVEGKTNRFKAIAGIDSRSAAMGDRARRQRIAI